MTKIKNTKKGMAKKTLSISLVAAMLATSNVPVWATEFGDGSDTVVEFSAGNEDVAEAAEVVSDAPVVEAPVEVAEAAAENTGVDTDIKLKTNIEWDSDIAFIEGAYLKTSDNKEVKSFDYEILIDGKQPVNADGTEWKPSTNTSYKGTVDITTTGTLKDKLGEIKAKFTSNHVGHDLTVKIIGTGDFDGFEYTTPAVKISAKKVTGANTTFTLAAKTYNGKQQTYAINEITMGATNTLGLTTSDFEYTYKGDTTNASTADKKPVLVATVKKEGYEGVVETPFTIEKRTIAADEFQLKVNTKEYAYTGAEITPDSKNVTVINTETKETLDPSLYTVSKNNGDFKNSGDETKLKATITKDTIVKDEKFNSNYKLASDIAVNIANEKTPGDATAKVIARNLSDCTITVDSTKFKTELGSPTTVVNAVKGLIHIKAGDEELTPAIIDDKGVTYTVTAIDNNTKSATIYNGLIN